MNATPPMVITRAEPELPRRVRGKFPLTDDQLRDMANNFTRGEIAVMLGVTKDRVKVQMYNAGMGSVITRQRLIADPPEPGTQAANLSPSELAYYCRQFSDAKLGPMLGMGQAKFREYRTQIGVQRKCGMVVIGSTGIFRDKHPAGSSMETCLTCGKKFQSFDRSRNRMCQVCRSNS